MFVIMQKKNNLPNFRREDIFPLPGPSKCSLPLQPVPICYIHSVKKKKTTRSRHIESHYNGVLAFAGSQYTALVLKTDSHPLTLHMGF